MFLSVVLYIIVVLLVCCVVLIVVLLCCIVVLYTCMCSVVLLLCVPCIVVLQHGRTAVPNAGGKAKNQSITQIIVSCPRIESQTYPDFFWLVHAIIVLVLCVTDTQL